MARLATSAHFLLVLVVLTTYNIHAVAADFSASYCSSQNTGADSQDLVNIYQSNGYCHDQCYQKYAFAVVQYQSCYCSNYIPADQTSTSDCSDGCPGFPDEKCGNRKENLWGYIALGNTPSGTQGASQPSSTSAAAAPSSSSQAQQVSTSSQAASETVIQTVTASVTVIPTPSSSAAPQSSATPSSSSPSPVSSSASSATPTSSSKSSSSSQTPEPTPQTTVRVTTVSGAIVTVTEVSTPAPAITGTEKKSSNTPIIAGSVVGGLVGIGAIVFLVVFLLRRRQKQVPDQEQQDDGDGHNMRRNTSTLSRTGLLREKPQLSPITTDLKRSSRHLDGDSVTPISTLDRRNSRHLMYDSRLNPSAWTNLDNASRSSLVTMEDNCDYTRTLQVRNVDPEPE